MKNEQKTKLEWLQKVKPLSANPANGQTHSNNALAVSNCLSVFEHSVGLALKGFTERQLSFELMVP